MASIRLVHLTIVGPDLESASVEFARGVTVIHGSSETGKSYIAGALDYMLGGKTPPKQIVEAANYTHSLLCLDLASGDRVTLARPLTGGGFSAFRSSIKEWPLPEPDFFLSAQHSDKNFENLSNFLLRDIGLTGQQLKKNQRNQTVPLSFRNVARYSIVDETAIQAEISPILTGQYVTRTAERSTFKLLIEGEDDSSLEEVERVNSEVSRTRLEVVNRLIVETEFQLGGANERPELQSRIEQIKESLTQAADSFATIGAERDSIVSRRRVELDHAQSELDRISELSNLAARFKLLQDQYESDLARLEMVGEVGELLGYFRPGVCVFCGADVEHQNPEIHVSSETTDIADSVAGEQRRTRTLLADLLSTIGNVESESDEARRRYGKRRRRIDLIEGELREIDERITPVNEIIRDLTEARSAIEKSLTLYEQLERLNELRVRYDIEQVSTKAKRSTEESGRPNGKVLLEFCRTVAEVLEAWSLPEIDPVEFDREHDDLVVAGRPRRSRGKGMRSILHAAFNIAILEYCEARELLHPGFVVLDSPLITYREPYGSPAADEVETEAVSGWVAEAFFRYLETRFSGQAVILENVDPPADFGEVSGLSIRFTKSPGEGRYGFFPGPTGHKDGDS